jgi:hypothetical protein
MAMPSPDKSWYACRVCRARVFDESMLEEHQRGLQEHSRYAKLRQTALCRLFVIG